MKYNTFIVFITLLASISLISARSMSKHRSKKQFVYGSVSPHQIFTKTPQYVPSVAPRVVATPVATIYPRHYFHGGMFRHHYVPNFWPAEWRTYNWWTDRTHWNVVFTTTTVPIVNRCAEQLTWDSYNMRYIRIRDPACCSYIKQEFCLITRRICSWRGSSCYGSLPY